MAYKFIFVKLRGCLPCTKFANSGIWERLAADKELTGKISFEVREVRNENKNLVGTDEYYINKAREAGGYPLLYLHRSDNRAQGLIYRQDKQYDKIKAWLLSVSTSAPLISAGSNQVAGSTLISQSSRSDKYDAIRAIHRNIMKNGLKATRTDQISSLTSSDNIRITSVADKPRTSSTVPTKVATLRRPVPTTTHSNSSVPHSYSIPSAPAEIDKIQHIATSSLADATIFKPNNFPSSLYGRNIKRGVSGLQRPYHPLYASNPDSDTAPVNEDKLITTFRFKPSRR